MSFETGIGPLHSCEMKRNLSVDYSTVYDMGERILVDNPDPLC
jgi:hypothetical protein